MGFYARNRLAYSISVFTALVLLPKTFAFAEEVAVKDTVAEAAKPNGLYVEYFNYEDYVYSRSKKTELGDQVRLDTALRYQYTPATFGRFRFETDPVENRFDNKTSKFELLAGHQLDTLTFQADGDLKTDDGTTGGTSLGFDLDSELTFVSWKPFESLAITFYPFNFNGEVGRTFNTWDVTRLYFVQGAPSTINSTQIGAESIANKTIPGLEIAWMDIKGDRECRVYVGAGAASYLYPANKNFDIETSPAADRWERREDIGYKAGAFYRDPGQRFELAYVGHDKSAETGSLLEAAASLYAIKRVARFMIDAEVTWTKAGSKPYRLDRSGTWFEQISPFQPIYSDYYGVHQDWLGKSDTAFATHVGYQIGDATPYLSYKHQGGNFIFRERESAHRLRTADDAKSHGGLDRFGIGSYLYKGDFVIVPSFEWLSAQNPVFGNSSDVREDRILSTFEKTDFLVYLTIGYQFGGADLFKP